MPISVPRPAVVLNDDPSEELITILGIPMTARSENTHCFLQSFSRRESSFVHASVPAELEMIACFKALSTFVIRTTEALSIARLSETCPFDFPPSRNEGTHFRKASGKPDGSSPPCASSLLEVDHVTLGTATGSVWGSSPGGGGFPR